VIAEYEYDGAKRRTIQKSYDAGTLDETRHLYYTEPSQWQVIEERVDSDTDPNRQFVWGLRYIDDLILRDRDTTGNGTLNERLYALQDANWNVTSVALKTGTIPQRFSYQTYGMPVFLSSDFGQATNSAEWEFLFCCYRYDMSASQFHVRHRNFTPRLGVWIQRDPLGNIAGVNLYEYANSTPSTRLDPSGLHPLILVGAGITAAEAATAIAASFGLSILGCMQDPGCSAALAKELQHVIDGLSAVAFETLKFFCKALNARYHIEEVLCGGACQPRRHGDCWGRWIRCGESAAKLACWQGVVAMRLSFVAAGCEVVLPGTANHLKRIEQAIDTINNCKLALKLNCS